MITEEIFKILHSREAVLVSFSSLTNEQENFFLIEGVLFNLTTETSLSEWSVDSVA